jgi:hypothetical protein
MKASTRQIGAWVILFCVSGSWAAAPVGPIKQFTGKCSTGQEVSGPVVKADAKSVTVRNGKKSQRIYTINLLEWSLEPSDALAATLKGKSDTERTIGIGESLLKKKWVSLAELQFRNAFAADPGCKDAILQAYKSCRSKPPKDLFEPIKRRYSRQRIKDVKSNTKRHRDLGKKMGAISPNTHAIETEHFVIYSDWSKKDDRRLAKIYEKLYGALCKQFAIGKEENIWIGKLPVFAFWKKGPYVKFSQSALGVSIAAKAAGYQGRRGSFSYVCLGPVDSKNKAQAISWFYQLLCHETTHAFIGRYISDRHLISWLNEGIAETMVAQLVPNGKQTKGKLSAAHKKVRGGWLPTKGDMFGPKNIPLDGVHYGCAQSMARYLIAKDRKKFIQLVTLIKNGTDPQGAMKEAYGYANYSAFLKEWKTWIRKKKIR